MFQEMIERIEDEVSLYIMKAHVESNLKREPVAEGQAVDTKAEAAPKQPARRSAARQIGRNDPCPCGSGKKYKHCHGANE
jgi:preprotein translocase subunit SecA